MNNHLSRETQEVYSRQQELTRNVIIPDTVVITVTGEIKRKVVEEEKENVFQNNYFKLENILTFLSRTYHYVQSALHRLNHNKTMQQKFGSCYWFVAGVF